jgi:signal peptidase I
MDLLSEYRSWKTRQRGMKEARLLLREARRVMRKYGSRLAAEPAAKVRDAIDALSKAVIARDWDRLTGALNSLDKRLDEHLGFARKSTAREYVESIGIAVLIALFLRAFVVEAFKIPSGSMIPTLQVGDHIFVNKFIYGVRLPFAKDVKFWMDYRTPRRGEVIVFVYPKEPDKDFIKRIVAVEGDTVEVRDDVVYVNGKPVPRAKIDGDCRYEDLIEESGVWQEKRCEAWRETVEGNSYTVVFDKNGGMHSSPSRAQVVPPHSVFVMGDNRDNSHDSRYWGFVPFDHIKGKAMVIWFSAGPLPDDGFGPLRFFRGLRWERLFNLVR